MQKIPVLDMQQDRQKFILEINDACRDMGFFYLVNHTISPALMQEVLLVARQFFALSQEEKDALTISADKYYRGYGRLEAEKTYGIGDYKETYDFGPERLPHPLRESNCALKLIGPNQWPASLQFKEVILNYIEQMSQLGNDLMSMIATSLNLENHFNLKNDDAHAMLRLLHYPASKESKLGVGEHVDSGFIALLLQDEVGGLQIKTKSGEWLDIPPEPNHFIVNIGEMLQAWTNNYYKATLHRVINNPHQSRISAPFFFEPNLTSKIRLPNKTFTYGNYLLKIFQRSFPT